MNIRTQLSLYVPQQGHAALEDARRLLDPVQAGLIPAHVTLCREDELASIDRAALAARLTSPEAHSVTLRFGRAEYFQDYGVLLPCIGGEEDFHALRRCVLGAANIRRPAPHLTLAHPRNPRSAHNTNDTVAVLPGNLDIRFESVSLIRQIGTSAWSLLERYSLHVVTG